MGGSDGAEFNVVIDRAGPLAFEHRLGRLLLIKSSDQRVGPVCFFVFQAEDGIRDYKVTGVQTCALPISLDAFLLTVRSSWSCPPPATRSTAAPGEPAALRSSSSSAPIWTLRKRAAAGSSCTSWSTSASLRCLAAIVGPRKASPPMSSPSLARGPAS